MERYKKYSNNFIKKLNLSMLRQVLRRVKYVLGMFTYLKNLTCLNGAYKRSKKMVNINIKKRKKNTKLTERNKELIRYIAQGYTDKEIAEALNIQTATVKASLQGVYEKTGTVNRPSLVYWACIKGII